MKLSTHDARSRRSHLLLGSLAGIFAAAAAVANGGGGNPTIGEEVSVQEHLQDGEEYTISKKALIEHGKLLFGALWTPQEGGVRPLTKGNGNPLTDPSRPLTFPSNMNRISAPDSNGCVSCHNRPFFGGGGDFAENAFVPAQRFDFVTFDHNDLIPTRGAVNEAGNFVTLQSVGNARNAPGMNGSGFIEMLGRQMTSDLQAIRNSMPNGSTKNLTTKGVSFGKLTHRPDGTWDTSQVEGLPAPSLLTSGTTGPTLVIQPFHQSGTVVSVRVFTNNAFNHHHGIQTTERFGSNTDPDGDGFTNEMTRADVTAAAVFQATLPVPGRVIPNNSQIENAIRIGERKFSQVNCTGCHKPYLPLTNNGWVFTEPNPFNPPGNLRPGDAPTFAIDLTGQSVPTPRLTPINGVVWVPAFTDLKIHDIQSGPSDPNRDPIDMNEPAGSPAFLGGNSKFITRKLWGDASEMPFFHHGKFNTMREAILAHSGEALASRQAFQNLSAYEQGAIVEFLKSLRVLPPGTRSLTVDEDGNPKYWPPYAYQ